MNSPEKKNPASHRVLTSCSKGFIHRSNVFKRPANVARSLSKGPSGRKSRPLKIKFV